MPHLIRSAVLSNYTEVARSVGLDPYRMISDFSLPAVCLTEPEVKVSAAAVGQLLEASAQLSGQTDFGLRMADQRTVANLGAMALLVREQPTIRKALDVLVGYMFLHSESLLLNMQERDGQAILSLGIEVDVRCRSDRAWSSASASCTAAFSNCFASNGEPQSVRFVHAAPVKKDGYRKFFGTDVEFSQDFNGIVCALRDIDVAVPAADAKMVRHVQQYLDTLASRRNVTMSASVRECIYTMLPSGLCSAAVGRKATRRRSAHGAPASGARGKHLLFVDGFGA